MVQLLPNSGGGLGPTASPSQMQQRHGRSQSTFVPMHSPGGSFSGGNGDLSGLGMTSVSRLHGSMGHTVQQQAATPSSAAALAALTSPSNLPSSAAAAAAAPAAALPVLPVAEVPYEYPAQADGYDVYAEIGSGAFSTVYRGVVRGSGEEVAIKVIDLDLFNTNWDEIRREILIMSQLQHPNVVRLKTAFVDGQDLWIVMHYAEAGSAAAIMKALQHLPGNDAGVQGIKDEVALATILKEVLQALAYFHKHGSIHRDVKAGNILLTNTGEVMLADFGVAGTLMEGGDRKKNRQTFTGTPCWMAPEVMEHTEGYDEKADIWSVGITAMELGFGRAPYAKYPPMKVMLLTLQEEPPTCAIYGREHSGPGAYEFSKAYHSMIAKCLRRDPKKRPTAKKLLEHKFFARAADKGYLMEHLLRKLPPRESKGEKMSIRKHMQHRQGVPAGMPTAGGQGDAAVGEETLRSGEAYGGAGSGAGVDGGATGGPSGNTLTRSSSTHSSNSAGTGRPGAGVKLGSWIFDEEDISSFKETEGSASLDLLTGTLEHQHALPHHAHHLQTVAQQHHHQHPMDPYAPAALPTSGSFHAHHSHHPSAVPEEAADEVDDVDEPEDEDDDDEEDEDEEKAKADAAAAAEEEAKAAAQALQQAQAALQQQQAALAAPLSSHSHQRNLSAGLSAAAAFAAAAAPSSAAGLQEMEDDLLSGPSGAASSSNDNSLVPSSSPRHAHAPSAHDPIDFFADVSAPAEQGAEVDLGPLSMSPSAAFAHAAQGGMLPTGGAQQQQPALPSAAATTPTLSSVQGKTRQFLVSEEEVSEPVAAVAPTAASATPSTNPASTLDLLSGDHFSGLETRNTPTAGGVGSTVERAASPLSLDALALAPGSATLAYLAAMGGEAAPAPVAVGSPANGPAPTPLHSAPAASSQQRGLLGLNETRARGMSSANEALLPVAARANTGSMAPSASSGNANRLSGSGRPASPLSSRVLTGSSAAEGLQLLDLNSSPMNGPLSSAPSSASTSNNPSSSSSSLGVPPSSRAAFNAKRGSGTLSSLGLGLLPVIRPTPTAAAASTTPLSSAVATGTGSACSSPGQRPAGSPASGEGLFASALQLDAVGGGNGALTLNIPSPPGSIQTPQMQQQQAQQQSGGEPAAAQVGRFQVISTGAADKI